MTDIIILQDHGSVNGCERADSFHSFIGKQNRRNDTDVRRAIEYVTHEDGTNKTKSQIILLIHMRRPKIPLLNMYF